MRLRNISLLSVFLFTGATQRREASQVQRREKPAQRNGEIMMSNPPKITLVSAALAVFALPVAAQSTSTTAQSSTAATTPVTGESIQDRKENQQDRIANGVKSGQLTAGETANLEEKQSSLNQQERDMRKLDNGKLTAADKRTLTQQ